MAVRGNPRKTGVCQRLGDLFIEGAREAGADVWDVDLSSLDIAPCMGCFSCSAGDKGTCVLKDDMEGLRKKLSTADALLCISPVYFYSMSAQMKIFWDRCFPFIRGVMVGRGLLANPALAEEYESGRALSPEERNSRFRRFHDELFAAYADRLQGDAHLLMKMKTFWEEFMPWTDRKILKRVHKATKLTQYKEAVNAAFAEE